MFDCCVACCRPFPDLSSSPRSNASDMNANSSVAENNDRRQVIGSPATDSDHQTLMDLQKKLQRIAANSRATADLGRQHLDVEQSPGSDERNERVGVVQTAKSIQPNRSRTDPSSVSSAVSGMGALTVKNRVTTCLENLKMSGNLTAVREMSGILLKVREVSGKKACQGKVA